MFMNRRDLRKVLKSTSILFVASIFVFGTNIVANTNEVLAPSDEISENIQKEKISEEDIVDDISQKGWEEDSEDTEVARFQSFAKGPPSVWIQGHDILMNLEEAQHASEKDILRLTKARGFGNHGWQAFGTPILSVAEEELYKLWNMQGFPKRGDMTAGIQMRAGYKDYENVSARRFVVHVIKVLDRDKGEGLHASDFNLPLSKLLAIRAEEFESTFIKLATAKAYDVPNARLGKIKITSPRPTSVGVHTVTFETEKGVKLDVTVTITDIDLQAQGAVLSVEEAQSLNTEKLINFLNVKAKTTNKLDKAGEQTAEIEKIVVNVRHLSQLQNIAVGRTEPYEVLIIAYDTAWDKKLLTVPVYVYDAVNEARTYAMNVHNFEVPLIEVNQDRQTAVNAMFSHSGVKGFELNQLERKELKQDQLAVVADFNKIKTQGVGIYNVSFQIRGQDLTRTVFALVTDEHTIVDKENDVMLRVRDFTVDVADLKDVDYIQLANAKAWRISTGEEIRVELVSNQPTTPGIYRLSYRAERTKKIITATITDHIAPILTARSHVEYRVNTKKSAAEFLADIEATLSKDGTIESNFSEANVVNLSAVGVYVVTLNGKDEAGKNANEVRVSILVTDNNTIVDLTNDVMLRANGFVVDVKDLAGADFVQLASAKAWRISTGERIPTRLVSEEPTTTDIYKLEYQAGGVIKEVIAIVTDTVHPLH